MRDKGKQKAPPAKRAKPASQRRDRQRQQMEKPTQARNQKGQKVAKKQPGRRDGDRFDSLVEQYKKKLLSSGGRNAPLKRSKWFDS